MKTKLLAAIMASFSMGAAIAATPDDREQFLQAMERISPTAVIELRTVGGEFSRKCQSEPSVAQYQALAQTEAYSFRLAAQAMGAQEAQWSDEMRTRYTAMVAALDCETL